MLVFQTLLIALLAGGAAAFIVIELLGAVSRWGVEAKLRAKYDGVNRELRQAAQKGLSGHALFAAVKIGEWLKARKVPWLVRLAGEISGQLALLGRSFATTDPYTFIGLQVLCGCFTAVFMALLLDLYNLPFLVVAMAGGFFIPQLLLKEKVKARQKALFRQIPDVLDMLTLMVEAGLDFSTALARVVDTEKGVLIDEFAAAQREVQLGKARTDAFEDMARRVQNSHLTMVINSLVLALRTGGSLAPTLRTLSEQFRGERSRLAEKLAGEAPVKLMFPLLIFIFPTIFIILFGPVLLTFMNR